eukprot:1140294-Pelagomonas_calceolata.AAC.6
MTSAYSSYSSVPAKRSPASSSINSFSFICGEMGTAREPMWKTSCNHSHALVYMVGSEARAALHLNLQPVKAAWPDER